MFRNAKTQKKEEKKCLCNFAFFSYFMSVFVLCVFFFSCDFGRLSHTQNDTHTHTNYESSSFGVCVYVCLWFFVGQLLSIPWHIHMTLFRRAYVDIEHFLLSFLKFTIWYCEFFMCETCVEPLCKKCTQYINSILQCFAMLALFRTLLCRRQI